MPPEGFLSGAVWYYRYIGPKGAAMCSKNEGKGCCWIQGWVGGLFVLYCIYCRTIKGSTK